MKKIIIPVLHLSYGGIEKAVVSLANELIKENDVEIVSLYKIHDYPPFKINEKVKVVYLLEDDIARRTEDYKIYFFHFKWLKLIKSLYNDYFRKLKFLTFFKDMFKSLYILMFKNKIMARYIKKSDGDVYIATRPIHNKIIGKYRKKNSISIAWEHNHHHNNKKVADEVVKSVKNCDYLITVSKDLESFYQKECKKMHYNTKVVHIPNFLENIPVKKAALNNFNIINVGRLSQEKGQFALVSAFASAFKKNNKLFLYLVGSGHDYDALEENIKERDLTSSIKMTGFKSGDELEQLYLNSSLFVMTSFTESFGLVLIEAMSYGIPCLAFDSAEGAREIISNDYNGYLIKKRDEKELVNKILELMSDRKKLKELSCNAVKTSLEYSKEKVTKKWKNLINNIN